MNAIDAYYESELRLVRPVGLIVLDNMLRRGRVADPNDTDTDTVALRSINTKKSPSTSEWTVCFFPLPAA